MLVSPSWYPLSIQLTLLLKKVTHMLVSRNMVPDISVRIETYFEKYNLLTIQSTLKEFPMRHGGKLGDLFW